MLSERGNQGEHEASKRAKAEFLIHLDGLRGQYIDSGHAPVLFLASTNLPWTLDAAFLRRFQKIVQVPLPGPNERLQILSRAFKGQMGANLDLLYFSESMTEGFSGNGLLIILINYFVSFLCLLPTM